MTAIAGFVDKEKKITYMACDSAGSNGFTTHSYDTPKVVHIDDNVMIGGCGSYRVLNLIKNKLSLRPFQEGESADDYTHKYLVDQIAHTLRTNGVLSKDKEIEEMEGTLIIAVRDQLYCLQEDLAVLKAAHGYLTIGSGVYHTEAAITALEENSDLSTPTILKRALDIASRYVMSVGGEIKIFKHKHRHSR